MNIRKKILLLFSFLSCSAYGQYAFNNTYGTGNTDQGKKALQLADKSFIAIGSSAGYANTQSDVYVLKTDSMGSYTWSAHYGGSGIEAGTDFLQTVQNRFIICGYSNSTVGNDYDIYVICIDSAGNLVWERTFGGADWDLAYAITAWNDSTFIIAGQTYSQGNGAGDGFLLSINNQGDSLWMKSYGTAAMDILRDVTVDYARHIVACGSSDGNPVRNTDGWIVQTDSLGNSIWENFYGSYAYDEFNAITTGRNGLYYAVGSTDSVTANGREFLGTEITYTGNLLFQNFLGGPLYDEGWDVIADTVPNVLYVVGNTTSYGLGGRDGVAYKVNTGYYYLAGWTFGNALDNNLYDIAFNQSSSLLFTGASKGFNGITDLWMINMDTGFSASPSISGYFDLTNVAKATPPAVSVHLYPNPAENVLHLAVDDHIKIRTMLVFDYTGRQVYACDPDKNHTDISVSSIPAGSYFMRLHLDNDVVFSRPFIIVH